MEKAKILIVDDEPGNLELLEAFLFPWGYEVICASSAAAALEIVKEGKIDMVLSDVMMPDMDGFELTRRIRQNPLTRLSPVVLLTALTDTEDRVRGIDAGCDDFISKPFNKTEVISRVKMLLKMGFYRRQLDEKEKFEFVLNEIKNGIIVFDNNFRVVKLNEAAKRLLFLTSMGDSFDFLRHIERNFKVYYKGNLDIDIKNSPLTFDIERRATDTAKALIMEIRSNIIRNPETSEVSNILMFIMDVTAIRQEEGLKYNFLGLISHKLRTPLTVMIGSLDLLKGRFFGPLNEEQEKLVNGLEKNSLVLNSLVDRLLESTVVLNRRTCACEGRNKLVLSKVILSVIESAVEIFKERKREVNTVFSEQDITIEMDRSCLDTIISELVHNAVKFNDKDTAKIMVNVEKTLEGVQITVSDNGRGIPPEEQDKIFDKFYQAERYFTGNVEGIGLGIPIVKRIVECCRGRLKVESVLGEGTKVVVFLPG